MSRFKLVLSSAILTACFALAVQAQTIEELASPEETKKVAEVLAQIGCKAEQVEKESPNLYEIDDATCKIGQYDIKLNSKFQITSMTLDE